MNPLLAVKKIVNPALMQINKKIASNQYIVERKERIEVRSSLSTLEKNVQLQRFHQQIINNFSEIEKELKQLRLLVAREYQRLKKSGTSAAELKKIAQLSSELQKLSAANELKKLTYLAPKTPKISPLAASLPNVPAQKVILDHNTLKKLVDIAIKVSWHVADMEMRQYVNDYNKKAAGNSRPIRIEEVKEQVCDELLKLKHYNVFGKLPQDISRNNVSPRMK